MYFKILGNYISGYLKIEIEGYYIERFINTCMKNDVFLWGITRNKGKLVQAKIGLEDYKKAIEIGKEHGCNLKIKKKRGVPFLIEKYKKRKVFFVFLIIVIALIFTLSRFIWNIDISGTEKIDKNELMEKVKEYGLKIGTFKGKIDTESIINRIRMEREDLAWIGIEIKGTNAIVKVVEAKEKPDIIDENTFTNIVADKDRSYF